MAIERTADAWRMHQQRTPMRAIAKALGCSLSSVHKYISRGRQVFVASISSEDSHKRQEERRIGLEAILSEAWANYSITKDPSTLDLCRKCEADLRKMYGDDAAEKSEVEMKGGVTFLPKEQMYAQVLETIAKLENKKEI